MQICVGFFVLFLLTTKQDVAPKKNLKIMYEKLNIKNTEKQVHT